MIASSQATPVGALFEAAFRRFGGHIGGYLLYAIGTGTIPALTALALRAGGAGSSNVTVLGVFWGAYAF